jgi:hypothetical protein
LWAMPKTVPPLPAGAAEAADWLLQRLALPGD